MGQPAARPKPQVSAEQAQRAAGQAYQAYGAAQSMASGNVAGVLTGAARRLSPLAGKSEKWWNLVSMLGGGVGGGLWYWYSSLDKSVKPDYITAVLMLLVPIALALLRRPIDRWLAPLIHLRRKLPRLVIVGIGIAAPFFVASFLYNGMNISEFPLIRLSVVLGPLASYLIIRTPNPANLMSPGGWGGQGRR